MGELATLPAVIARNAAAHGSKPALVVDDDAVTHAELEERGRTTATRLVAAGVGKGSRLGLLAPNGIEWAVIATAVMRIGAVLVPLSTLLRPPELEAQMCVAGVTHLILAQSFRGRDYPADLVAIDPGLPDVSPTGRSPRLPFLQRVWLIDGLPGASVDDALVAALEGAVRPADDLAILFTSGSRGAPKGVIHTHGGGLHAVASSLDARRVAADDRLYVPMPFFWTGGFCTGLLSMVVAGATLLAEAVPEPERTLAFLERERVTLFRGWPDQAARLAAHPRFAATDLSGLGPGSLPGVLPTALKPVPGRRPNIFGMTETFGPYCGGRLDLDMPDAAWGSCGRPFEGIDVAIADPDAGAPCAGSEVGEIRVRGINVMRGMCGRTRDVVFTADGYYPTGDMGAVDAGGYLWYHGRRDDMFKVSGATVYPQEVETALRDIPGVRQAHVTNVTATDGSDAVGALVVSAADAAAIASAARTRLSGFKVPTRWVVTDGTEAVPMNATAKVDKAALRTLLEREGVAG